MDKSDLAIKPINFIIEGLRKSSDKNASVSNDETASVFSQLKNTMENNGNSISSQDFYKLFSDKYSLETDFLASTTNTLASMDGTDYEISFKDFGLYEASYEILQSLEYIDKDNISQEQVTSIANVLNSTGTEGKSVNQLYGEIVSALGFSDVFIYSDIQDAVFNLAKKLYTNEPSMDSKIFAYDFTNMGKAVFESFLNSQNTVQKTEPKQETTENEKETIKEDEVKQVTPIEVSVEGWIIDNSQGKITTGYGETLVPKEVNKEKIIMADSGKGYGIYYDKPNSTLSHYKGRPLGYYTQDKNGNTVFFEFDKNSSKRLPEGYTRVGKDIFDANGNKMHEQSNYEATLTIADKGYGLEQGNYDKTNRKIFDKNGNLIGVVRKSEDGYATCFFYEKPIKIEAEQPKQTQEAVQPQAVTSTQQTDTEETNENEPVANVLKASNQEPAEQTVETEKPTAVEEIKKETPKETAKADENSDAKEDITNKQLIEILDKILANDKLSSKEKLEQIRELKNKYGASLQGKLEYSAKNFYFFILDFLPKDTDSKDFNADNLIEMIETYKFLTGCDFSNLGKDLKKQNKARLDDFLYGMFNSLNLSNSSQARKLNEYFDFVKLIQQNYSGKKETEILGCLFAAVYNTAEEDAHYAEKYDVDFKWYCVNKSLNSINRLTLDENKSTKEAKAYIYKACDGDISKLIKEYRNGMVGANATQEKELSMLLKLFLGYSLDEIKK